MIKRKKIRIGKKCIEALTIRLQDKNFILLKGKKGYIMCGYLNMKTAERFKDVAVKITGVSNLSQALSAKVHSCSRQAGKLGISRGQPVKKVLKIIA